MTGNKKLAKWAEGEVFSADDFFGLYYSLGRFVRRNSWVILNPKTYGRFRLIKDTNGYLWSPESIVGLPYIKCRWIADDVVRIGLLQCKYIDDFPILETVENARGIGCNWYDGELYSVRQAMPMVPGKVAHAKMRQLISRGLVSGCKCGCRGDFELTEDGKIYLAAARLDRIKKRGTISL